MKIRMLIMAIGLAGCAGNGTTEPDAAEAEAKPVWPLPPPPPPREGEPLDPPIIVLPPLGNAGDTPAEKADADNLIIPTVPICVPGSGPPCPSWPTTLCPPPKVMLNGICIDPPADPWPDPPPGKMAEPTRALSEAEIELGLYPGQWVNYWPFPWPYDIPSGFCHTYTNPPIRCCAFGGYTFCRPI